MKVCSVDWPAFTGLLSLKSHSYDAMAPFGSIAMNVTASGAGPFGSDMAVGVAESEVFSWPWVAPGAEDEESPPPQPASETAANTTRELHKALATLALIPEVTSVFIVFLPVPLLTGSALCRRGRAEKIGETDEAAIPCAMTWGAREGFSLGKVGFRPRSRTRKTARL